MIAIRPGPLSGCGHLIAGTTRVWETISGAAATVPTTAWYITNNPAARTTGPNLTKGTLGNRSYINQVKYSPKYQTVAIVGTNDGNVQIGFNLGTGVASQANWVNVTGDNVVLPNRPILGIALDPSVSSRNLPVGYAAVGGFNANTPTTPGHLFQVTCGDTCATFTWADKTGNLPDIPVDSVIVNPNYPQQVFAGTDFGLYYTNDVTAATPVWFRFQQRFPLLMIWDMDPSRQHHAFSLDAWPGRLRLATAVRSGAFRRDACRGCFAHVSRHRGDPRSRSWGERRCGGRPEWGGNGNFTIIFKFENPLPAPTPSPSLRAPGPSPAAESARIPANTW